MKVALQDQIAAVEAAARECGEPAELAAAVKTLRLFQKHEQAIRTTLSVREFITTPRPDTESAEA